MSVVVGAIRSGVAAIAADSLMVHNAMHDVGCKFVALSARLAFGAAGDAAMRQWFSEYYGQKVEDAPEWTEAQWGREHRAFVRWCRDECDVNLKTRGDDPHPTIGSTFVVATPSGLFMLYSDGFSESVEFVTVGSGEEAAAGARAALERENPDRDAEHLARSCVEAACAVIGSCGGPVVSFSVPLARPRGDWPEDWREQAAAAGAGEVVQQAEEITYEVYEGVKVGNRTIMENGRFTPEYLRSIGIEVEEVPKERP